MKKIINFIWPFYANIKTDMVFLFMHTPYCPTTPYVELKITVPPALHNKESAIVIKHEDIAHKFIILVIYFAI